MYTLNLVYAAILYNGQLPTSQAVHVDNLEFHMGIDIHIIPNRRNASDHALWALVILK